MKKDKPPSGINPQARKQKRVLPEPKQLADRIVQADRFALARAITLVESRRPEDRQIAAEIIQHCLPHTVPSLRIGITGSPGVGKSTFIEAMGLYLIQQGKKVAVLAIDPSSQLTGGSILGDKTRMETLSRHPEAFIRPSPAGDSLGGVARKTRETIILAEAAGFDSILIETVGVGQSEHAVSAMTDFFLLLLQPGAGDELQGIKRGIVEMADLLVVNKADGDRITMAKKTKQAYRNAVHLLPPKENGWTPEVALASGLQGEGMETIWQTITRFQQAMQKSGAFQEKRRSQATHWFYDHLHTGLRDRFFAQSDRQQLLHQYEEAVQQGELSPFAAAEALLKLVLDS